VEVIEAAEEEVFDDPDTGDESIGGTEVRYPLSSIYKLYSSDDL